MNQAISHKYRIDFDQAKRVLFYSSVEDKDLFRITGFYATDISILIDIGLEVNLTNSFKDFLKFWQYDIAFIYFWTKGLIPAIIGRCFLKKVIFTGGIDALDRNYNKSKWNYLVRKILFKLCVSNSDSSILVSKSDLENARNTGCNQEKLTYLPHVIDVGRYGYDGTPKKDIITTVVWMHTKGNVERKGVHRLLHVYKEYLEYDRNMKIIIIGSLGEGTAFLKEIAQRYGLENMLEFTGRIDEEEKIRYLKESKFYFQLSEYEGFGIAALEALSAGNIIIHSGRGGLSDTVGSFGICIQNIEDYKSIAEQLNEVNQRYDAYSDLIEAGIEYVQNNFAHDLRRKGLLGIINKIYGLPSQLADQGNIPPW
jgi:glycosyltransferase involved in cell wall biosynthesis